VSSPELPLCRHFSCRFLSFSQIILRELRQWRLRQGKTQQLPHVELSAFHSKPICMLYMCQNTFTRSALSSFPSRARCQSLVSLFRITDEELSKISDNEDAENDVAPEAEAEHHTGEAGDKAQWPSVADLNTRLRRVISSYQRNFKREEMKMAQRAKLEKREKIEQMLRGRHHIEALRRWSRREESDFFRTVSTFGVEYDRFVASLNIFVLSRTHILICRKRGQYDWSKFRAISRLDRKQDEAMTEYYRAFCTMLKRVCGMKLTEEEGNLAHSLMYISFNNNPCF
jgi:hypothetical protein